jgi:hypothetical protein
MINPKNKQTKPPKNPQQKSSYPILANTNLKYSSEIVELRVPGFFSYLPFEKSAIFYSLERFTSFSPYSKEDDYRRAQRTKCSEPLEGIFRDCPPCLMRKSEMEENIWTYLTYVDPRL